MSHFHHPLGEVYPASPETDYQETINTWECASMIASVATGYCEGDRPKAITMAVELIRLADHILTPYQIIDDASKSHARFRELINLIEQGLTRKLDEAFKQRS